MFLHRLVTKKDFQKLIKYLREYITDYYKDDDDEDHIIDFSSFTSKILQFRSDAYYDKKFNRIINVFEFVDEFKIEISEEELDALILILFNEVDLMNQNTEAEIKKEKNIWHFDSDLAQYFPNGKIMRCLTIMNHFRPKLLELLSSFKGIEYYSAYCYDTKSALKEMCTAIEHIYDSNRYYYKFDNGLEIILNDQEIENISNILTDSF